MSIRHLGLAIVNSTAPACAYLCNTCNDRSRYSGRFAAYCDRARRWSCHFQPMFSDQGGLDLACVFSPGRQQRLIGTYMRASGFTRVTQQASTPARGDPLWVVIGNVFGNVWR